ncbi:MAG: acetate uptake transporter [Deltaproteobacteria bacterium]|nr:acetate uptake transporter [Deltaproteobacteria bacterium]
MSQEKQNGISSIFEIKDSTANPAPLGLLGFGMTTVLLNLANAGVYSLGSIILAMGVFYGGIGQVIAGIEEWKKKNTFGATAFTSYGLFWLTFVAFILFGKWGWIPAQDAKGVAAYLIMWGLFTFVMFIGTLRLNKALQVVFFTLFILFFLLAAQFITGDSSIGVIAGWEGIICGLSAMYAGLAQILNEVYGRTVLPL